MFEGNRRRRIARTMNLNFFKKYVKISVILVFELSHQYSRFPAQSHPCDIESQVAMLPSRNDQYNSDNAPNDESRRRQRYKCNRVQ
jgi:hypothetical protein